MEPFCFSVIVPKFVSHTPVKFALAANAMITVMDKNIISAGNFNNENFFFIFSIFSLCFMVKIPPKGTPLIAAEKQYFPP